MPDSQQQLSESASAGTLALVRAILREEGRDPDSVIHGASEYAGAPWIRVSVGSIPAQGWKLHVSSTPGKLFDTARRTLPVLIRRGTDFKIIASTAALAALNAGAGGRSQIGKSITVYPRSDAEADDVAAALDAATSNLTAPRISSDFPYRPGGVVYYRYGSFGMGTFLQLANGEIVHALHDDAGRLHPDRRDSPYIPTWAPCPFASRADVSWPQLVLGDRYVLTGVLSTSLHSQVFLAVDVTSAEMCVVKRVFRDADAPAAASGAAHEAEALAALSGVAGVPRLIESFPEDDDDCVVMSFAGRHTVTDEIRRRTQARGRPDMAWGVEQAISLAQTLTRIHEAGFVHGDVKTSNVLFDQSGRLTLVDYGTAVRSGGAPGLRSYTEGYVTSARRRGEQLTVADDVHGLGAVLYALVTGAEPSLAAQPNDLFRRPPTLLNPACGTALEVVVERALSEHKRQRYSSIEAMLTDMMTVDAVEVDHAWGAPPRKAPTADWIADATCRVARSLTDALRNGLGTPESPWRDPHPVSSGAPVRDLHVGLAGVILSLVELHDAGAPTDTDLIRTATGVLLASDPLPGGPLPGLMVGECGIGLAAVHAGLALGDEEFVTAGLKKIAVTISDPWTAPDYFVGTAGRVLAYLLAAEAGGDSRFRRAAIDGGRALVSQQDGEGGWVIPPGFEGLSGSRTLGYAHGAAGIGDVLLMLYEQTADQKFRRSALHAAEWVMSHAIPMPGGGMNWPASPGHQVFGPVWCHGSAGMAIFLLRASEHGLLASGAGLLEGALHAAARAGRVGSPVQCHGLAGNIEVLLDAHRHSADPAPLAEALSLADVLAGWELIDGDSATYPSDARGVASTAFWVGYGGVGTCLARLQRPSEKARILSLADMRRRAAAIQ